MSTRSVIVSIQLSNREEFKGQTSLTVGLLMMFFALLA